MSWQLASLAILVLALAAGFGWYDRSRPSARVLSLVAALAALAVVGRLAFAAIPNVKPTTDIVLFAGYALGAVPGFAVGAITAIVSNIFLSQGPWTAWQMAGWGAVGIGGAMLARFVRGRELPRWQLAAVCGFAGLAFGAWMDVYQWTLAATQSVHSYLAISATSLPYNLAHAIGNVVFCLLIGPVFLRALRRYRRRFEVRWEAPAVAASALLALVVVAGASAPPAQAKSATAKAVTYLKRSQNRDGGFGGAPGQSSSQLFTGWSALGLAAAKVSPRDVHRRHGRAITTFIRKAGSINDTGELERTILVLRASGLSIRRFSGRNLLKELLSRRRSDGSWKGNTALTSFGLLALRAAGDSSGGVSAKWLRGAQDEDGGFGFAPSATSDTDDTGSVLQSLAAAGRRTGTTVDRAVSFLSKTQNSDGGFGQMKGYSSNAQSTAWAVQGLVAVGRGRAAVSRGLGYLKGLQRRNGSFKYSRSSAQTPVWVTAQAITALKRKPFPLGKVRRKRKKVHVAVAAPAAKPRSASKKKAAKKVVVADAPSAPVRERRPDTLASEPTSAVRPAAKPDDGPPGWLIAGAATLTLLLLAGLRLHLRRRRPA